MATSAEQFKAQGNEFLKQKDYEKSIEAYTRAIEIDPNNYLYYSNRSAAYASCQKYQESFEDAQKTVELNPSWGKGYSRLGASYEYLGNKDEAIKAYRKGLSVEPDNVQLQNSLDNLVKSAPDPNFLTSLLNDPKMREMFGNPEFINRMNNMSGDPSSFMKDGKLNDLLKNISNKNQPPQENKPQPPKEDKSKSDAELANIEKEKGNEFYKKREFEDAINCYNKAKEIFPKTIVYDLNIAAALFEQKKYDECVKLCEELIEVGREYKEPFKTIARALVRIGNCYSKQGKLQDAITYYNKSLSEFRDPEIVQRVRKIETELKEQERLGYINPSIAEEEKKAGNELFAAGNFPEAIKKYSEAIKRNPNDPRNYSNRAACYTKLMEYQLCIIDCDVCIKLDPTFIKGYLRKANALLMLRDAHQAKSVYEKALEIEKDNNEALTGMSKCYQILKSIKPDEAAENALRDPEVQDILKDPNMKMVLDRLSNDPNSAAEYLRDPVIARKIEKLINAGIIKVGS